MSKQVPDSIKQAKSPFIQELKIPVFNKQVSEDLAVMDRLSVENDVVISLGATHTIKRGYVIEKDRKVNLYYENDGEDLRPAYSSLSKEGRMLLEYILLYCLRENKLYCYIDFKDFMEKYNVFSRTTVWSSKKNLIDHIFIAPTSHNGWYWINPKYMFKGYRTKVYELQDNLKIKEV
jgi:hypothetical protein